MGKAAAAVAAAGMVAFVACTEETPSGPDDTQIPTAPVTVSLQLPWSEFGSDLRVYGGFGRVDAVGSLVVAHAYDGLESRALMRFDTFPRSATVRDSTNDMRMDTALTFVQAYVVLEVDTAASTPGLVQLGFSHTHEKWETSWATWTHADSRIESEVPWSVPGGGAVTPLATWEFDPSVADSAQLFFDAATIQAWREGNDSVRSGRVDVLTDGHRLKFTSSALRVVATSQVQPDTVLIFTVRTTDQTFIYDPPAAPPADGMRVGGAPAWRTVMDVTLPTTLDGPPALCATVGCPFALGPQHVTYAALQLRTRASPLAFHPTDTLALEVRSVLDKATLPKAPLGVALGAAEGTPVPPEVFDAEGSVVDLPITRYVQQYLSGPDPSGRQPPSTIAVLAAREPSEFSFASFFGPGGVNEPVLNLVLTVSPPMEIR